MNDKTPKVAGIELPPCPMCGGILTMPNRMGMSFNNCECSGCSKTFSAVTAFGENHIAKLKEIYANVGMDTVLANTTTRIFLPATATEL